MIRKTKILKTIPYASGGNIAGEVNFAILPRAENGKFVVVDEIRLRVYGTMTNGSASSQTVNAGGIGLLISNVTLDIPNVSTPVKMRGVDLLRLHKFRTGTAAPGTGQFTINGSSTGSINASFPIRFGDTFAKRSRDFALPAALLADAQLNVTFAAASAVDSDFTGFVGSLEVTAVCSYRDSLEIPSMTQLVAYDYGAGTVQPQVNRSAAKWSHLCAARTNGASWATSDFTKLGLAFGSALVQDRTQPTSTNYALYNDDLGGTVETDHTSSTPNPDDVLPMVWQDVSRGGDRQTEAADARVPADLYTDTAAAAWTLIGRQILTEGPWMQNAARILGISGNVTAVTADGEDPGSAAAASTLPRER